MTKLSFLCIAILTAFNSKAQDTTYARKIVNTLAGKDYYGRGYVNKGIDKACSFLEKEFKKNKLTPLNKKSYLQRFSIPVNTFPGKMEVIADGKKLIPGVHYIVSADSKGVSTGVQLFKKDSVTYLSTDLRTEVPIVFSLKKKLTWSVAPKAENFTVIELLADSFKNEIKNVDIQIENKEIAAYKNANVCGYVKGSLYPDSFIVFTAHYDHLGMMGKEAMFTGANDNASGTAMLLSLMRYYAKPENKPKYSIAFISFAGEEAGLVGSKFFVDNTLIPFNKIKFLTNLDLMGTGQEGITVVNATEFKSEFESLKLLNAKKQLLFQVKPRGKAQNSDHYWFTQKGVRCFFIYTMGGIKAYHDVFDKPETLPLNEFSDVFTLLVDFTNELQG